MTLDSMTNLINKYLEVFSGAIDLNEDVPKAFTLYQHARQAFLEGDIVTANKIKKLIHILHNCEIPYTSIIGKNTIFAYGGIGVIIHSNVVIGERANIGSNVTIGGTDTGIPKIGHDVYLATGAKLLGGFTVGNGAIVGANAVLTQDVADFEIFAGMPARKIGDVTRDNFSKYSGYYWCKNQPEKNSVFLDYYFPFGSARS